MIKTGDVYMAFTVSYRSGPADSMLQPTGYIFVEYSHRIVHILMNS